MPITPYTDQEIPQYQQRHLNDKMQNFVNKLTGITVPEMNLLEGLSLPALPPIFLTVDGVYSSTSQDEELTQVYYFSAGTSKSLTFSDADVIHDYSAFTDNVLATSVATFTEKSIVSVWWKQVGANIHAYFVVTFVGVGEAAGVGAGEGVEPVWDIVDTVALADFSITDY